MQKPFNRGEAIAEALFPKYEQPRKANITKKSFAFFKKLSFAKKRIVVRVLQGKINSHKWEFEKGSTVSKTCKNAYDFHLAEKGKERADLILQNTIDNIKTAIKYS